MKIALEIKDEVSQHQAFRSFIPWINEAAKRKGQEIEWVKRESAWINLPDLAIVDYTSTGDGFRVPYIILEPKDGAGLTNQTRKALTGGNPPSSIWKNSVYTDLKQYNRFHGRWQQVVFEQSRSSPNFADEFVKIRPGQVIASDRLERIKHRFGFESFEFPRAVLRYPEPQLMNANREFDVFFAGWTDYGKENWVNDHRLSACREIEKLNGLIIGSGDRAALRTRAYRGRPMTLPDHWQALFNTKVAVCPWGLGETTIRFYEAIFAGCVTVGPPSDWIDELPAHFICKPDFSDLPEVVVGALDFFHRSKRLELRSAMLERYNPQRVGELLWADIKEAAGRSA